MSSQKYSIESVEVSNRGKLRAAKAVEQVGVLSKLSSWGSKVIVTGAMALTLGANVAQAAPAPIETTFAPGSQYEMIVQQIERLDINHPSLKVESSAWVNYQEMSDQKEIPLYDITAWSENKQQLSENMRQVLQTYKNQNTYQSHSNQDNATLADFSKTEEGKLLELFSQKMESLPLSLKLFDLEHGNRNGNEMNHFVYNLQDVEENAMGLKFNRERALNHLQMHPYRGPSSTSPYDFTMNDLGMFKSDQIMMGNLSLGDANQHLSMIEYHELAHATLHFPYVDGKPYVHHEHYTPLTIHAYDQILELKNELELSKGGVSLTEAEMGGVKAIQHAAYQRVHEVMADSMGGLMAHEKSGYSTDYMHDMRLYAMKVNHDIIHYTTPYTSKIDFDAAASSDNPYLNIQQQLIDKGVVKEIIHDTVGYAQIAIEHKDIYSGTQIDLSGGHSMLSAYGSDMETYERVVSSLNIQNEAESQLIAISDLSFKAKENSEVTIEGHNMAKNHFDMSKDAPLFEYADQAQTNQVSLSLNPSKSKEIYDQSQIEKDTISISDRDIYEYD